MPYRDSLGQLLNCGDEVSVLGHNGVFKIVDLRPEGVAVVRNTAEGYLYTSSVPLRLVTAVAR